MGSIEKGQISEEAASIIAVVGCVKVTMVVGHSRIIEWVTGIAAIVMAVENSVEAANASTVGSSGRATNAWTIGSSDAAINASDWVVNVFVAFDYALVMVGRTEAGANFM